MNNAIKLQHKTNRFHFLIVAAILLLQITAAHLNASETYTNCSWLSFGLSIPRTNLVVGGDILVSMVCSNASNVERNLPGLHTDPCGTGFGEYRIIEMVSGKKIECQIPQNERVPHSYPLNILQAHMERSFTNNLANRYAISNAGNYIVQAVGQFRLNELLNRQYTTLTTPPIIISLLPKSETNAPPK